MFNEDRETWSDISGLAKGLNHRSKNKYNAFYDSNGGRSVNEMPKYYEFEGW